MGAFNKISMTVFMRGAAALFLLVAIIAQSRAWAAVPPPGALIVNTVTADYTDASGTAMPRASGSISVTATGPASLALAIDDVPDPVYPDNTITFTITVQNDGDAPLTGVALADTIPADTMFVSADSGGVLSSGTVSWDIGGLGVGESATVRLVVRVDAGVPEGRIITDTVTASSNETPDAAAAAGTSVVARTQGVVMFTDSSWDKVYAYAVGDTVYVKVTDPDRNVDIGSPDVVEVEIIHYHAVPGSGTVIDDTEMVSLTETGSSTGVFTGLVAADAGPPVQANGVLSVELNSLLKVTYTDPLDPVAAYDDTAYIDPLGIVFDSSSGLPVPGAVVTLIDDATGLPAVLPQPPGVPNPQPNPVTTDVDGRFRFEFVDPGTYRILVEPGQDHSFPSLVPAPSLPPGYFIVNGSRGESFTVASGMGTLKVDMPVDPNGGMLDVAKTADRRAAAIGDVVSYTVTVTNGGTGPVAAAALTDKMPHGVEYVRGSTTVNGSPGRDPEPRAGRTLVWGLGSIAPGARLELSYSAVVGPDAAKGSGVNTASAQGYSGGGSVVSGRAVCKIDISEGVFTSRGTIIGKVFVDGNADGVQQPGEHGLPEAVLYLEDGTRVITDTDGKYTVYGVPPGTHVVKIDTVSLPEGCRPAPASNRFAGDTGSQFVDMVPGLMFKANFAVEADAEKPLKAKPDAPAPAEAAAVQGKTEEARESDPTSDPLEESIKEMTPGLEILEPKDGLFHVRDSIDVVVKAHSEAEVSLTVNGAVVDERNIGKKMELASRKVVIYRYVAVPLEAGKRNIIRAEMKDPFGNVRGVSEVTVVSPGRPETLAVTPERPEAPADGLTVTTLSVKVLDENGNLVAHPGDVTVTVTAGEIVDEDADKTTPGVQLHPEMGVVSFGLRSPMEAAEARVGLVCGTVEKTVPVYFYPHLRDIMAVGVGEAVLGYGATKGGAGYLGREGWFKDGLYAGGRGAFFVKGDVGGGVLMTMAYDSEKDEDDVGLFHEKTGNVESEELYPIYGDESRLGYEADSADELYLRLDRGRSYLMYGDYRTELSDTRLSAFRRSFTGIKSEINEGIFRLKGFASRTDRFQAVDTFQGRGIAGYYFLKSSPVVDGSELVVFETRDRLKPDRVIKRETMTRWTDYNIDYSLGAVLFKEPVPSADGEFNPVYIIVSYESEGGEDHYVYGGRAAIRPLETAEAGFTGVVEENGFSDYRLIGADTIVKLPYNTTLKAEWARSDSIFTEDGVFNPRRGDAWYVRLDGAPLKGLKLGGIYYDFGDFFKNDSAVDVQRGKKGYELEFGYELGKDTRARGRLIKEEDGLNGMDYLHAEAGVETSIGATKLGLMAVHESSKDRFVPRSSPDTRFPFDISEQTAGRMTALKFLFETPIWKDFLLRARHTQDILHNRNNLTEAGLDYKYSESTRFYVHEQYATYDDRDQLRTVAGVESNLTSNTVAFSEYRLSGAAAGYRNQHAIGLRNKFSLGKGVTGNVAVENLSTLSGPDKQNEPDAFALSAGLEYLPMDELKASTRLEYRDSSSEVSRLAELGLAYKLHRDLSMFTRGRYFDARGADTGERSNSGAVLGFAYRPVDFDALNALAKAEYRHETRPASPAGRSADSFIFSAEAVYQLDGKTRITGKYAGKYTSFGSISSYTDLFSARLLYDITDKVDAGLTYRVLTNHLTGSSLQGGSVELGYNVFKNIWLSAGYSFDGFDADLAGDDYQGHGPYVKIRAKFTESLFK